MNLEFFILLNENDAHPDSKMVLTFLPTFSIRLTHFYFFTFTAYLLHLAPGGEKKKVEKAVTAKNII